MNYTAIYAGRDEKQVLDYLRTLTPAEINLFSPVEKFDIYVADYKMNATRYNEKKRGAYREGFTLFKGWNGYCNGVCAAGALVPEPVRPVIVTNHDGLVVTFMPADLKGLAASAFFYVEKFAMLGAPTKSTLSLVGLKHNLHPPNMGLIDILLRGYMSGYHRPIFMDKKGGYMVSNVTIIGYEREVREIVELTEAEKNGLETPAVRKAYVRVTLEYLMDNFKMENTNQATTEDVAEGRYSKYTGLYYLLYLDAQDRIVEGVNLDGTPDFIWTAAGKGADDTAFDLEKNENQGNRYLRWDAVKALLDKAAQNK